jgi:hypothetical protein
VPRQPRRYSNTVGVPPELLPEPSTGHAPIPVRQGVKDEKEKKGRLRIGLPRLSMATHEPDPKQLIRTLFGKEAAVDDYTGRLVLAARPATPT